MCLRISKEQELVIAETDIDCYKIVIKYDDKVLTLFQKHKIEIGCSYRSSVIRTSGKFYDNIEIGLHSFCEYKETMDFYNNNKLNLIEANWSYEIVRCIIPKGSKYYKGTFNYDCCPYDSYASTDITYVEIQPLLDYNV